MTASGGPAQPAPVGKKPSPTGCRFDPFASAYDEILNRALKASGENLLYFARRRVDFLAGCLRTLGQRPRRVLDYGCGKGASAPLFLERLGAESVLGVDTSPALLAIASSANDPNRTRFLLAEQFRPEARLDLAFCNGVFHHIVPAERAGALSEIFAALQPGGFFALWENNPWSLGARYVMSRIPFDADAVTLSAPECRKLVRSAGFQVVRTDFLFIFPRVLAWLRPLEARLSSLPLGAQYQVLCWKTLR